MQWNVTTPPTIEPITLDELKAQLRRDGSDEDGHLELLIEAARDYCERYLERALMEQTIEARADKLEKYTFLPQANLMAVNSVSYIDSDLATQVVDPSVYRIIAGQYGALILASGQEWPTDIADQPGSFIINYQAGYGAMRDSVPPTVRMAMKALCTFWDTDRDLMGSNTGSESVDALLQQNRFLGL